MADLLAQLASPQTRLSALQDLCNRLERNGALGEATWNSPGISLALLSMLTSSYRLLEHPETASLYAPQLRVLLDAVRLLGKSPEVARSIVSSGFDTFILPFLYAKHAPCAIREAAVQILIGVLQKTRNCAHYMDLEILSLLLPLLGGEVSPPVFEAATELLTLLFRLDKSLLSSDRATQLVLFLSEVLLALKPVTKGDWFVRQESLGQLVSLISLLIDDPRVKTQTCQSVRRLRAELKDRSTGELEAALQRLPV